MIVQCKLGVGMAGDYRFEEYDKHFSLKLGGLTWLVIAYLMRSYLILLSSIKMGRMSHGVEGIDAIRKLVYPNDVSMMLGIVATIPVLVVLYAHARRKPGAPEIVRKLWHYGKQLLVCAAILDIIMIFMPVYTGMLSYVHPLGWIQVAITGMAIVYLLKSVRVRDAFADFPEGKAPGKRS